MRTTTARNTSDLPDDFSSLPSLCKGGPAPVPPQWLASAPAQPQHSCQRGNRDPATTPRTHTGQRSQPPASVNRRLVRTAALRDIFSSRPTYLSAHSPGAVPSLASFSNCPARTTASFIPGKQGPGWGQRQQEMRKWLSLFTQRLLSESDPEI